MTSTPWLLATRSPQTLLPRVRETAPQWVAALFGLIVGLQVALLVTRYFRGDEAPAPMAATLSPSAPRTPAIDVASILSARLFGAAEIAAGNPSDAPQTSMPLVLAGVLADSDPQRGFAIIGETAAAAKLRVVGDSLPGGAKLHAIYSDRVIIDRGGTLESVTMPRQLSSAAPLPAVAMQGGQSGAVIDRMRQMVEREPGMVSDLLRPQKVFAGGQLRGYRVYPGRNPQAFQRLGLRPGDLITSINGTPLDDPARGDEVMRTLGSAAEVRVGVTRNGRQSDITLNMAQLAAEADQAMSQPGLTPMQDAEAMPAQTP